MPSAEPDERPHPETFMQLNSLADASIRAPANRHANLADFFRNHGFWAPGVRLFRRLGFRAKAIVISSAFVLPIVVLAWNYFGDKASSIEFSAKEQLGVDYAKSLFAVLDALQARQLQPGGSAQAIEAPLKALADQQKTSGEALGTATLHAALASAGATAASGPPDALGRAVAAALDLLGQSTDGSNLTLDPDIDTYYLMDVAMFRAGPMSDDLVQLAALALQPVPSQGRSEQERRLLIEKLAELKGHAAAMKADLAKARAYNAGIRVGDGAQGLLASIDRVATAVDAQLGGHVDAASQATLRDAGASALASLREVRTQAMSELARLLDVRVTSLQHARNATAALLSVSLLMVVYLFTSFRKVLDGGLREVAFHINAMRSGDLTTSPRPWGVDEAAQLMWTLLDMQASLRTIVSQVRTASDNLVQASAEISAGSHDLSSRTERSAANLEQSASAMEQIAGTVQQTAQTAREASGLAQRNARTARHGGQVVGSMITTMDEIQLASHRIAEITGAIDAIAFQSNILALNAAVEAARAGEAGRGFAVVAAEVRQLAQRAAASAREIKLLVNDSIGRVDTGSQLVKQSGDAIQRIVHEAARVNELLGEIARGATDQARGVRQTTESVQEMDAATQQNAALVQQTAASATTLAAQARGLAAHVQQFKLA